MPPITLWFLQASRSIRIAWLLEELGLDYEIRFADRMPNMKAPNDFKASSGNPLGKFPSLKDGDITVYESGAITEIKVLQWLHAAEATFLLHALAITYVRWNIPSSAAEQGVLEQMEAGLAVNVQKDLDWLETELSGEGGKYLCGERVTAADTMMVFSIDFIFATELGVGGREWPNIMRWLKACKETDSYKRAVEKSGYSLTAKRPEV
ncbi:uncharacterized protein CC84DRAFT_1237598 [Paraphaeosphaeria sporulosa]|uniref:Glutathione S-transferase n=1 Tax=Paraphaeosphaeria sporulosa TaxID=1460663 RepID=A0A177CUX0_9PLEO|nr:uncharacterized protein CC84DRAFT_1237598 [Paraphaeosphaeria sporulosa]OAG10670.1 hypothetical protein CC84DRAFT_1237598 [Paraphaeosphaeria sporulosa]